MSKINKLKIINDPVHGFIKIPYEILFDVIEHPYFQRLRRISQTGLLNLVFPGATHTRFHHALGAMHLMFLALETLKLKGVKISKEEEQSAMLAILLHDVGHGPFSHALESVLMEDWHHEKLSLLIMSRLNDEFSGALSVAIEMFQGNYHRKFFNQLVSSQLDVDRLDYLKRDSFFTGVSEGNINAQRLISMMNVADDELVIDAKGIYSVENYLTARMLMYWQVYYHKTASLAEFMLVKILKRAKFLISQGVNLEASENLKYFLYKKDFSSMSEEDLSRFINLDDTDVLQAIKLWQNERDLVLSYYCKAIITRKFPQTIWSSEGFSQDFIDDKVETVNKRMYIDFGVDFVDEISRYLLPYDSEKQPIYLLEKKGGKVPLDESELSVLSTSLKRPTQKYILAFPR
ncbi:HD domain-containing protein [Riemerella anatipestifer]|uniref:Metal dependent phosphohydrolase n=1 Tax=Riemerella anatipestifer (strain ATCC 11845 / DSM 15868 / JCM 9532 / NCTC 11014) TaxID=693978 RepID=E4T9U9_RIEAD|nr:HD domain-containing protein [Riemerella anatipestifer]ADQ81780.1 metal dependent phosphohydrolase [Riemerella anatipestifer ATCC 11845 = DSM 15868]ADZ12720.1 HD superfamily phosphohydrolase [Riemerella anatipestifer RA-GD]AFD55791.1 metal dependent phosphohydrolase [Riemerella anatipestifer ATCC 11845 = DSM 15868]AGC40307.1 HD superfamily phosphohydrolase [Riemerella anatipestifer RA-CH-2]AKP69023.1 metal dependent phosphohydrolase [Riemerella anatipestifer]